ncbi:unnamed protein product [Prunus armeniaca]
MQMQMMRAVESYHLLRVHTLVYQPFALITMVTLAYHEAKLDTRKRNLIVYALFFLGTLMLIVVVLAMSRSGAISPYIGICACVGAFGGADAHVQGGMAGDLSFMRPEFIQIGGLLKSFAGLAASGALTSGMRLMTKAAFEKYHNGLLMFLAISTLIEFLCILRYAIYFPRLPIVNYYRSKAASEGSKTVSVDLAAGIQTQADIEVSLDWLWLIGKSKF